ncbi:glutathione S-transferase THETA 3 [Prunus dulcis]|uniref:Glutathione S-transferase THETA 3 n=1 Tax=Prunus dulcis TaxID=3755 RepID=A0A4Y1QX69_PRUDU|nr:glutathione S-transferase THETA 3 [Prunus dulcis]
MGTGELNLGFERRVKEEKRKMSLVDYASSDDDVSEEIRENKENEPAQVPQDDPQPPTRPHTQSVVSSYQQPESTAHSSAPSIEKLPDASMLLNSPVFSSNIKVPKGNLPHSKNVPDTIGGMLVPPQLSGRSNIVTEDVGKLFVKKQADPSPK